MTRPSAAAWPTHAAVARQPSAGCLPAGGVWLTPGAFAPASFPFLHTGRGVGDQIEAGVIPQRHPAAHFLGSGPNVGT